jgi:hypothetical protein
MPSICPGCDTWRSEEAHHRIAPHDGCVGGMGETLTEAQERRARQEPVTD